MTQWGLDNLFNPGKRHMDDEKRRLQSTREEVGDNSGGRRIDLEGGKVSISVRRPTSTTDTESAPDHDATSLPPALEAEDVPAIALAGDEAEFDPGVDRPAAAELVAPQSTAAAETGSPAEVEANPPAASEASAEGPTPAPRRRLSAKAWSRGG